MPEGGIPACFRGAPGGGAGGGGGGGVGVAGQSSGGVGTSLATSVYETRLGVAALSWSRAALGLSLRVVLRVAGGAGAGAWAAASSSAASDYGCYDEGAECYGGEEEEEEEEATVAVRVRPWLLWRRRGSKRVPRAGPAGRPWRGTSRARGFAVPRLARTGRRGTSSPVVVDGEMALVAGDMAEEAYRKTKARRGPGPDAVLISRREHVSMRDAGHGPRHKDLRHVRGKEREISVDLVSRGHGKDRDKDKDKERDKADVGMSVTVDGERVLHIRRLRWKFRGTEKVDLGGGDGVQVSWDLHHWLFPNRDTAPADASAVTPPPQPAHAVFIFRFELADIAGDDRDSAEVKDEHLLENAGSGGGGAWAGYLGRWGRGDWSESSSNGENRRKRGQARRLAKASSSSSASVASSSASWASGSTVMDWASPEEAELQRGHGFSLLVYAWKC
ncbi:hypothetical protein OsI_31371 [Oryza sativa Indica Group]|uniref:Uncharacterized protein n=1 Tax=Oryza sativa subsp. indica TaxID=39946 RepID=A2Z195_ORYSI|nr:hypothetical protein OsI_31371 [Oryza sativa Indica Group]